MKRFPIGSTRFLLLLLLHLNMGDCSTSLSTSKQQSNLLVAKFTREVQFEEGEKLRTISIESDITDCSDNEEHGKLGYFDLNIFKAPLLEKYELPECLGDFQRSCHIIFEGCSDELCNVGGDRVRSHSASELLNGSGLTSTLSERESFESEMTRSGTIIRGSFSANPNEKVATVHGSLMANHQCCESEEETGIDDENVKLIFGPFFISETCSLAEDFDTVEFDCFERRAVDHFSVAEIFDILIPFFQSGQRLTKFNANQILDLATERFQDEAAILNLEIHEGETLIVVGDIHGQFEDLIRIFVQNGRPTDDKKFIFNGDIVDRGPKSLECLLTLLLLKIVKPYNIFITRGNHESLTCGDGTFKLECFEKMDEEFFFNCHEVFDNIPLGYIINKKVFVCHGGLPSLFWVDELRGAEKPDYKTLEKPLVYALLWNDPHEGHGMKPSRRGGSTFAFGSDVTADFLKRHGFELLIRSHEYHQDGYFFSHERQCLTVFSAPNYCGIGNKGTVIRIGSDMCPDIIQIETPDSHCALSTSMYTRREKERSMTMIEEENEFVFLAQGSEKKAVEADAHANGDGKEEELILSAEGEEV